MYIYIWFLMCLVMLFLAKANEWKFTGPGETGISGGHDCLHCPRRNREGGFTPRSGLFITKSFDVSLQPSTWQKSVQGMQCFLPCWECFAQSLVPRSCLQGAAQSAPWVYFYCAEGTFRFQTAVSSCETWYAWKEFWLIIYKDPSCSSVGFGRPVYCCCFWNVKLLSCGHLMPLVTSPVFPPLCSRFHCRIL